MDKVDDFSRVLDRLNVDEKDKLLTSAQELLKAQKAVKDGSAKPAKQKTVKEAKNV